MNIELLSNLVIKKVHSVSTIYSPQNKKARKNDRKRWAIVLKYEGETVYTANGKQFWSDASHMVILPMGCSYEWQCTKSGHCSILEFESEKTFPEPIPFSVKHGEKLLKMFKELEYKRNLRAPLMEAESIRDTYSIILNMAAPGLEKYVPDNKRRRLQPAIEYISQNFSRRITNDTLAAASGMSTVYFRKLFAETMGVSPIAYAKALRIEKAKEMLKSDYGTLSDIAQSLGYSSLYDFSRDFKKHTGSSPSKYENK